MGVIVQFQAANSSQSPIRWIDELPTYVTPIKYDLETIIDLKNDEIMFSGNVKITVIHFYFPTNLKQTLVDSNNKSNFPD